MKKTIDPPVEEDISAIDQEIGKRWKDRQNLRQISNEMELDIGFASDRLNQILKRELETELKKRGNEGAF